MRPIVPARALLVALVVALGPVAAAAVEWEWSANAYNRFTVERNRFDASARAFERDAERASTLVDFTVRLYPTDRWRASITLDTGELSERTFEDGDLSNDSERNLFVREAYATYAGDAWGLHLGKRPTVAGRSYILDDFLVGADLWASLPRLAVVRPSFELLAAIPEDLSDYSARVPVFTQAALDLEFTIFDHVRLFGAWLRDRDDLVAEGLAREAFALERRFAILDARSRGDLSWFGAEGDFLVGPVSLSGIFIWQRGRADLDLELLLDVGVRPIERDFDFRTEGFLFDVEATYGVTESLYVSVWFLMASGDEDPVEAIPAERTYRSFLGVRPFITRTNLFFSGGLAASLSTRTFAVSGTEGRGFVAPGLTIVWDLRDDLRFEYKFAYLRSEEPAANAERGRTYGFEQDFLLAWMPLDWLTLSVEFDTLKTGDFYENDDVREVGNPWQLLFGADVHL